MEEGGDLWSTDRSKRATDAGCGEDEYMCSAGECKWTRSVPNCRPASSGMQFNRHYLSSQNLSQLMSGVVRHVQTCSALVLRLSQVLVQFCAQNSKCLLNCTPGNCASPGCDGPCIPKAWHKDGIQDCSSGSDEEGRGM